MRVRKRKRKEIVYADGSSRAKSGYIRWKMVDVYDMYSPITISISTSTSIESK